MNRIVRLALFGSSLLIIYPSLPYERPAPPQILFGDLYAEVEIQGIFRDSKEFADATPRLPPPEILRLYHEQKPLSPDDLTRFISSYFVLPGNLTTSPVDVESRPIRAHIDDLWGQLTRYTPVTAPFSSLLPLPRPYVVPGGRFRELHYWDSYFTMLGLAESGRAELVTESRIPRT